MRYQAQAFCGSCGFVVMAYYWHAVFVFIKKGGEKIKSWSKTTELCFGAEPVRMATLTSTLHVGPRGVRDSVNSLHVGLRIEAFLCSLCEQDVYIYHPWVTLVNSTRWV